MWRILLESIKKGFAPPGDPTESAPVAERFRGLVTIAPERCDQSAECVRACPTHAISLTADPARWEVDLARCLFCGLCQQACPRGAITLDAHYQLAVRNRDDLRIGVNLTRPEKGP